MIYIMDMGGRWLSDDETQRFKHASDVFLSTYQYLAAEAQLAGQCNFKFRPKLHDLCHIIDSTVKYSINHRHRACFNDEDLMGRVARVGRMTHRVTFPLMFLKRHLLALAVRWTQRARSDHWLAD